jgi:hypothetical protein
MDLAGIAQSSERRDLNLAYTTPFPKVAGANPAPRSTFETEAKRFYAAVQLGSAADWHFDRWCEKVGLSPTAALKAPLDTLNREIAIRDSRR